MNYMMKRNWMENFKSTILEGKTARGLALVVTALLVQACASTYTIHSTPQGANVYYVEPVSQKKVFLGTTPFSYNKSGLPQQQAFMIQVTKEGFKNQDVPMAATDESKTLVSVRLKPDDEIMTKTSKELNELLKRFFKAQQLIYDRQYHSAIIELDQLIKERPDLVQAYVMKGTSYFLLNETKSAVAAWKVALKLDPENVDLLKFLQEKNVKMSDLEAKQ